ncbi:MAG: NAD(P)-dependent oxidoreductase [Fimbriimonadales bacterium]|nr:NAD(P)-dependent oxidoreductase [Fimbriimonadales bacterium]
MAERVVVTGASGGIGSRLMDRLAERGYDVLGLDRKPPRSRRHLWAYADLNDREHAMRHLDGAQAVIHLGEFAYVWGPWPQDEVYAANTRIASTVLETAASLGARRLLYASSAQVYGSWGSWEPIPPVRVPVDESHPLRPRNAYAASKVANEAYLSMLAALHEGAACAALRFPWVMGTRHAWADVVAHIRERREPEDGFCTYVHVDDVAEAFCLALERSPVGFEAYNVFAEDLYNLVPTREYLASAWPGVELPDSLQGHGTFVDCSKAERLLGWRPERNVHRDLGVC